MRRMVSDRRARGSESGFALLLVFVLAAAIAISLYMEMPRVAFEKQRDREQLLVDRGLQYRRAIQVYYRKFGLYPTTMDDLETKNSMRFLRRRYKDPMTGKDEWRLIHMGPGGVLTDSLLQKPVDPLKGGQPGSPGSQSGTQAANGTGTGTGTVTGTDPNNPNNPNNSNGIDPNGGGINFAVARRPSDHVPGSQPGQNPNDPNQQQYPGQPGYPGQPQDPGQPQYPGQQAGQPGQPGQPGVQNPTGQPGDPNQQQPQDPNNPNGNQPPNPGQQPGVPGQYPPGFVPGQAFVGQPGQLAQPGQPGQPLLPGQQYPGQPLVGTPVAGQGQPFPTGQQYAGQPLTGGAPGTPGFFPGQQYAGQPLTGGAVGPGVPGQVPNAATNLIQQAIFGPRQPPSASTTASAPGSNIAAGSIAGVASKAEGSGIKIFNDHKKYKEWEFIFDFRNPTGTNTGGTTGTNPQNPLGQQPGTPQQPTGSTPTTPPTTPSVPPVTNQ